MTNCDRNAMAEMVERVRDDVLHVHGRFAGTCEGAAVDLSELLAENGVHGSVIDGRYDQPFRHSDGHVSPMSGHVWIEVGNLILDPTREQFGSPQLLTDKKDAGAAIYKCDNIMDRF